MATIIEIAKKVNLSKSTISKYINGEKVREENRLKIEKVIKELNYRPNFLAQGLKTSKTYTVGVLVPYLTDMFAATIITIIEQEIKKFGYSIMVSSYQSSPSEFKEKLAFLYDKLVDFVVLFPSGINEEDFSVASNKKTHIISIDKKINLENSYSIIIDNEDICYKACKLLCECGHKKIAIITGHKNSFTAQQRVKGCLRAFEENHLDKNDYLINFGNFSFESGRESAKLLLTQHKDITAIFATNYYLTNGVLKSLNDLDMNLPNDVSFIGFDGIEISNIYKTPLTLVLQPMQELGLQAAKVIKLLSNNILPEQKEYIFHGEIRKGNSIALIKNNW